MKASQKIPHRAHRSGLTLIELLVVLSIIAVLSTVAMRSVVGRLEQQNYDANVNQLEEIEKAVLGDGDDAGFLGDIGRLPQAVGINPLTQLEELWAQGGLPDYEINTPTGDAEIRLGTGWRGPYLHLGLTRDNVSDGFGNPFGLYEANGDLANNPGETIAIIQSLGLSMTIAGTGYEEDVETVFEADAAAVTAGVVDTVDDRWRQDVTVNVVSDSGQIQEADGRYVIVRVYGADGGGEAHTIRQEPYDFDSPSQSPPLPTETPDKALTLQNLPIGALVFRAYQLGEETDASPPAAQDEVVDDGTLPAPSMPAKRRSPATHVVIDRFTSTITLTLY